MGQHRKRLSGLPVINARAAGIDVGSRFHVVAVAPDRDEEPVCVFNAFTLDIHRLADWLVACGVTSVAWNRQGCTGSRSTNSWRAGVSRWCWPAPARPAWCRDAKRTSMMPNGYRSCTPVGCCARASGPAETFAPYVPTSASGSGCWTMPRPISSTCRKPSPT